ncbi:MAG: DUF1820 family protein [Pseudomonadota bacterium]|nr:DUF1820 family protein [Pseudomonadota bacterium]
MSKPFFRVTFQHQDTLYTVYARRVRASELWGFVEIAELDFDQRQGVLIDPVEERLRDEFSDTRALHLPMHNVLRVEEVAQRGASKIQDSRDPARVVMPFPAPRQP